MRTGERPAEGRPDEGADRALRRSRAEGPYPAEVAEDRRVCGRQGHREGSDRPVEDWEAEARDDGRGVQGPQTLTQSAIRSLACSSGCVRGIIDTLGQP